MLVLDGTTGAVVRRILSGLDPVAVGFSPDGAAAYVSNARDRGLTRIDLATFATERVETFAGPNGLVATTLMPQTRERKTLTFAAVLPLSGRDATFGREMMLGYELWRNDVNERGGVFFAGRAHRVATRYLDTGSDPTRAADLARTALAEGAELLLGSYGTPDNGAVARVAAAAQVPLVTAAGAGRSLFEQGNRFLLGVMAPASEYLIDSVEVALRQTPGASRAASLTSDAPAPLEDARNAARHARARGLGMATLPPAVLTAAGLTHDESGALIYAHGRGDLPAIVAAFAGVAAVDLVVMAGDLADGMGLVREAKRQKFAPLAFSFSVGPSVPLFATAMGLGADASGLIGATPWTPAAALRGTDRFATAAAFADAYWQAYHARPSYLSAGAYATGLVYENALRRGGSSEGGALREALAATDYETFYGRIRFNANGLNEWKPVYTIQLEVEGTRVSERLLWPIGVGTREPDWPFPGWGGRLQALTPAPIYPTANDRVYRNANPGSKRRRSTVRTKALVKKSGRRPLTSSKLTPARRMMAPTSFGEMKSSNTWTWSGQSREKSSSALIASRRAANVLLKVWTIITPPRRRTRAASCTARSGSSTCSRKSSNKTAS